MSRKIIFLKGLPASGKSTWAKKLIDDNPGVYKRVNKDDLRAMVDNGHWSKKNETFIKKVRDEIVRQALKDGYSVIVDDTNLDDSHLRKMEEIAFEFAGAVDTDHGVEFISDVYVEVKDFTDVPLEECLHRDKLRPNSVGSKVILDMYNRYLRPTPIKLKYDQNIPDAIIVDLDGTLAIHNGRGPYDIEKCETDIVNIPLRMILREFETTPVQIILCSGRSEDFRALTEKWLSEKTGLFYSYLYMRPSGDTRNDTIIKKEIYDNHIKGKFNVLFAVDDRKRIKRMWVENGIYVFDVNQTDEEF